MKIQRAFLQSKVARRFFSLFVLAALIPILLTSYLAYQQLSGLIRQERIDQLEREVKQLSTITFERLLNVRYRLSLLSESRNLRSVDGAALFGDYASAVVLYQSDGTHPRKLFGEPIDATDLPAADAATILTVPEQASTTAAVYLIQPLRDAMLLVKLRRDYLWPPEYASYGIFSLVFDSDGSLLHYSAALSEDLGYFSAVDDLEQANTRQTKTKNYLLTQRALFLESEFDASDWTFYSVQPEALAARDIGHFARSFVPPLLLSILLITAFSLRTIRRNLIPIDRLVLGTKRIRERDFSHAIQTDGDDEFKVLADAFNEMRSTLKSQFDVYENLSEIDQLILRSEPAEVIVAAALRGFLRLSDADAAIMLLTQRSGCYAYRLSQASDQLETQLMRVAINHAAIDTLLQDGTKAGANLWISNTPEVAVPKEYFVHRLTLVNEQEPFGTVIIASANSAHYLPEEMLLLQGYASRVAIAMTALERREQLLLYATRDSLTGIANRREIERLTAEAISALVTPEDEGAFLFVDLDNFKNINDAYGHKTGDKLLVDVAQRLRDCLPEHYKLARFGGDEFVVLVPRFEDIDALKQLADSIITTLSASYTISERLMYVGASIGIATFPSQGKSFTNLLQNADIAMYSAKHRGRGLYCFFNDGIGEEQQRRAALEVDIREALKTEAFELFYQPKVNASDGKIKGFEALLRWNHPREGYIPPIQIFSVAEESGLVQSLDDWVFQHALEQIQRWRPLMQEPLTFAINFSAESLQQMNFISRFERALTLSNVPPSMLEIEITETVFMDDLEAALGVLEKIHQLGVAIALDDFGTGYSSLSYLHRLPIDTLKIDRSFVSAMAEDTRDIAIVDAIIALAHGLNMRIVAEGVETEQQAAYLQANAGGLLQGYLFGKPLPVEEAQQLIENPAKFVSTFKRAME